MRQHVNPLSTFFQEVRELPKPDDLFENSDLPICIDIGCAKGKFLMDYAFLDSKNNYLGLDIRQKMIDRAENERVERCLNNLRFLFCNVNVSLPPWIKSLKNGQLGKVLIQFPDPWFKKRHNKRRVLQAPILDVLASKMNSGAEFFIQSDVLDVMNSMIDVLDLNKYFDPSSSKKQKLIKSNPYNISTERELYALQNGLHIYKALYIRNSFGL